MGSTGDDPSASARQFSGDTVTARSRTHHFSITKGEREKGASYSMSKHIRKVLGLLQHRKQIPPPHQQPTSRTPEEWSTYWKAQGQPWRTEPEIDKKRQENLAKRRLITPNIEQGIYPFKGEKLSRADVEWLLSTHETGGIRGPVDGSDERQREREGLDVRGADLCKVDLRNLPLARLCGGA